MSAYKYIKVFLDREGANGTVRGPNLSIENIENLIQNNIGGAIPGPYTGDTEAASNGVPLNSLYRLSQVNDYDIKSPGGRTVIMRIATILLLILSSFVTVDAQFITNELISELDTMQTDNPGDFKSPWRYSRSEDQLYRWNYDNSIWNPFGFNSGNIFYISTNGDNTTGRKGYMNLPFTPTIQFDSVQNRTAFWYYPGIYNIGTGQEYPVTFNATGNPFPVHIYAPNSTLNIVGGAGSQYIFRLPGGGQTDTVFNLNVRDLIIEDATFLRTSEGKKAKILADIRNLTIYDNIAGGDATFVIQQGYLKIDSIFAEKEILYADPKDSNNLVFDVEYLYSNQTGKNKNRLLSSSAFYTGTNNGFSTKFDISEVTTINAGTLWRTDWGSKLTEGSTEELIINNANIVDTTNTIDTLYSTSTPGGTSFGQANTIEFAYMGERTNNRKNVKRLKIQTMRTDKIISLNSTERASKYFVEIGSAEMRKRRLINIGSIFSSDTCDVKISCESCISEYSTPISNFNTDATTTIEISGTYQVKKTGMPIIYSAGNLIIENAQLINDGVTPAIIAPTPITVYVRGDLYMNSDSINSNVTFVDLNWSSKDYTIPASMLDETASNYTLPRLNTLVPVDVSGGTVEIDLPTGTPSKGDWFIISDSRANSGAQNITVDFTTAGDNFQGAAANDTIATNGATVEYIYIDSTIGWIRK